MCLGVFPNFTKQSLDENGLFHYTDENGTKQSCPWQDVLLFHAPKAMKESTYEAEELSLALYKMARARVLDEHPPSSRLIHPVDHIYHIFYKEFLPKLR